MCVSCPGQEEVCAAIDRPSPVSSLVSGTEYWSLTLSARRVAPMLLCLLSLIAYNGLRHKLWLGLHPPTANRYQHPLEMAQRCPPRRWLSALLVMNPVL